MFYDETDQEIKDQLAWSQKIVNRTQTHVFPLIDEHIFYSWRLNLLWACNVSQLFVDGFPQLLFLFIHLYLKHVGNVPMVVPMLHVWCVSHQSKPIIRYLEGIHPYTICFGVSEGTRVLTHTCVGVSSMIYIYIYTYYDICIHNIYTCFAEHIRACSQ